MRTYPDPETDDALLDATLQDEIWQATNAALKKEALGIFRTRQRVRRLARWTGSVAATVAVLASVAHWVGRPAPPSQQVALVMTQAPKAPDKLRHLTDQDLVAAFPKGTCFIAEVDGKKELVFLDPEVERSYVSRPRTSGD